MAVKRVKAKDHEKLSDSNVAHVIGLLEAGKPITKKEACEILNIAYNTTRLNNIIEGYKSRKAYEQKQKDKNRGKPATEDEIQTVVKMYLKGNNISDIAKDLFRSTSFVKGILDRVGVPQKAIGEEKFQTAILPDECVKEEFAEKEIAWSAKYHSPCQVLGKVGNIEKYGCDVYKIFIMEPLEEDIPGFPNINIGGFFAYSPAYDLGSLSHLEKYRIRFDY